MVLLSVAGNFIPLVALSLGAVGYLNYFFAAPIFSLRVGPPLDLVLVGGFLIAIPTMVWSKLPAQ